MSDSEETAAHMETASTDTGAVISVGDDTTGRITWRQCYITVINYSSEDTLCNPCQYTQSGRCTQIPPPQIGPQSSGSALFTKTPYTARGSVGVMTYDLQDSTEKIAVMFSVPYDYSMFSNVYAVGIFDKSQKCNYDLYYKMYYDPPTTFVRGEAKGPSLTYKGDQVTIVATMADLYETVINVEVRHN
ncbi:bryoporin-like [Perca fluviatilis]|uniref:bryoporin-like n=1 Tax=Perca fluviatilis TaxID=8168 RepID=UPI001964768E|nr:bryoporin-like [Perca fluviatilis]XP_039679663.1 bryoporin-like [Perca fluviatilis]